MDEKEGRGALMSKVIREIMSPRLLMKVDVQGKVSYTANAVYGSTVVTKRGLEDVWMEQRVIGYAEFPLQTRLRRFTDFQKFKEKVEEIAEFVAWFELRPLVIISIII